MNKYVIGIDPDSKKHGVALYVDGVLESLFNFDLLDMMEFLDQGFEGELSSITVHMEDNVAVSAAYKARDNKSSLAVKLKMAQHIGMCKQSQIELERLFDRYRVKVVKHKQARCWKETKQQFEMVTGWKGRSNADTRSAAYFGFLGCK